MEDQRTSSHPIPTITVTAGRTQRVPQTPDSTADMTIEELMAHIKRRNKKFKI